SAGLPPMIRVDGDVRRINIPALDHKQVHALVYDIMSDKQRRDLVFGTLHTSSAAKTIDRIIDVFPAGEKPMVRSMLSESLRAVI
ncbi:hypothetical protein QT476_22435, partial [Xanthomonas citri pv. citri]